MKKAAEEEDAANEEAKKVDASVRDVDDSDSDRDNLVYGTQEQDDDSGAEQ